MSRSLQIMRTFAMHQPHFLPWLPYFAKLASASKFVVLDNVQYRRYYYQARTRVRVSIRSDETRWLVLPVKSSTRMLIRDIKLAGRNPMERVKKDLTNTYHKAPHFDSTWPTIKEALSVPHRYLLQVNIELLYAVFSLLGIAPPSFYLSSELTSSQDRELRIAEAAHALEATLLLVGWGGSITAHDQKALQEHGVTMVHVSPTRMLAESRNTHTGLTILDTIFLRGTTHTAKIIEKASSIFHDAVTAFDGTIL